MPAKSKRHTKNNKVAVQSGQQSASSLPTRPKPIELPPPKTVAERTERRYYAINPIERPVQVVGEEGLTPTEKKTYNYSRLIQPVQQGKVTFSSKKEREFWKQVNKEGLPRRQFRKDFDWGKDRYGREFASYPIEDFKAYSWKQVKLTALKIEHRHFLKQSQIARKNNSEMAAHEIDEERQRREEIARLKRELYGEIDGPLVKDLDWDDVIPIPQVESDDALAKIAYPEDYLEVSSYLRAVMANEEHSPRCLRLTERLIAMNPAHYTVWLYRFKIISVLKLSVADEILWLNDVAMDHLKNYQIWHHRQLLLDYYHPTIASDETAMTEFAKTEIEFINKILAEDTKNYHVWSYRQYLVTKLGLWTADELESTSGMIEEDVRNNSAWAHRFFLVFSDPKMSTQGLAASEHDPAVPSAIIDREIAYAQDEIALAPQNPSGWNYLRGVLAKAGRSLTTLEGFADQFVSNLGEVDEAVRSSHALDLLSEVYHEKGDSSKAEVCLRQLAEKWDPIREGYWKYRAARLNKSD